MNANSISVHNLRKRFPGFLLDDISFQVPCGRIVGFIGENGAGKSTTIKLILDQLRRDGGSIEIFGEDNTKYLQHGSIGVVFDECKFHDVLNAQDLGEILSGIYNSWDQTLYTQYLKQFGIPLAQRIKELSKGMKMKLSIICAISHHPDILILDEATTGLDPVVRDEILDLFLDFIQDEKHSILFSMRPDFPVSHFFQFNPISNSGQIFNQRIDCCACTFFNCDAFLAAGKGCFRASDKSPPHHFRLDLLRSYEPLSVEG
jgi:ABC-2 type transport system ATP-binding protein